MPKLTTGGIVKNNNLFVFNKNKKSKNLFEDKYYKIYKRTKKRRIKKKQMKKSWILKLQNSSEIKYINKKINQATNIKIFVSGNDVKTINLKGGDDTCQN